MDAHVHMVLDPNRSSPPGADELPDPAAMRERAAMMVRAGITSARDLGGGAWRELDLRDAIERGEVPGPRLLCSGQPVTCPGGHCHFWGGEAADAAAARAVIDRQVASPGGSGQGHGHRRPLHPRLPTARAAVRAAGADRHRRLRPWSRGSASPPTATAPRASMPPCSAGVHSIEHCSWVGDGGWASDYQVGVVEAMLKRGTWVSPTINAGWQRMLDANNQTLTRMRAALIDMRARGVPFMASTDAGIPGVFHHELPKALGVYGKVAELSNEQVLRSATSDAARGLGLERTTGRLATGFDADVLVVDGDPLQAIDALIRPVAVWARGSAVR